VKELQEFTNLHKGEKIILKIERGKEIFEVEVIPRVSPPEGEGPIGLALVRTAIEKYPWQKAIWRGISTTGELSLKIVLGYFQAIKNVFKGLPSGVQMMGPVGIFHLTIQAAQFGLSYFLNFIALISIYLAIFNILPIPAVDGGKLLFLGIEAVRKRPVSQETEQKITAFCFGLLILIAIFVTIKDIARILKL
jgi:regulator of sigma E protease